VYSTPGRAEKLRRQFVGWGRTGREFVVSVRPPVAQEESRRHQAHGLWKFEQGWLKMCFLFLVKICVI